MGGVDRDEPGLVRERDGTVWLVNPDGTRMQLPGGGGSQLHGCMYQLTGNQTNLSGGWEIQWNSRIYDTDQFVADDFFPGGDVLNIRDGLDGIYQIEAVVYVENTFASPYPVDTEAWFLITEPSDTCDVKLDSKHLT